jgi:hypothetical protein
MENGIWNMEKLCILKRGGAVVRGVVSAGDCEPRFEVFGGGAVFWNFQIHALRIALAQRLAKSHEKFSSFPFTWSATVENSPRAIDVTELDVLAVDHFPGGGQDDNAEHVNAGSAALRWRFAWLTVGKLPLEMAVIDVDVSFRGHRHAAVIALRSLSPVSE